MTDPSLRLAPERLVGRAAKPRCMGVHCFPLYDRSALGRFDGENYNIGFLDACKPPCEPLATAPGLSHERIHRVATGVIAPYSEAPEYLQLLFMGDQP